MDFGTKLAFLACSNVVGLNGLEGLVPHRRVRLEDSEWDVWDVRPENRAHTIGNELKDGWLCFQSGASRRRLAPIPDGWDECEEEQLEDLFQRANPVLPAAKPTNMGDDPVGIRGLLDIKASD